VEVADVLERPDDLRQVLGIGLHALETVYPELIAKAMGSRCRLSIVAKLTGAIRSLHRSAAKLRLCPM
jgi:hypothetical protein